jgi:predicted outer membrane protein
MDNALALLRSVLLGALGGLSAFALAGWLGWMPPVPAADRPQAAAQAHPVVRQAGWSVADTDAPASEAARRFISEAARGSLYDAQAARLMHACSADAAVQDLAARLLRNHEAAWPALRTLARHHGVALPEAPTTEQRETLALLRDVTEHTRAHLFVRQLGVETAHSEIARFEAALRALDGTDAPLRGWIEQTLPALRERAALSQRLLPRVAGRRPMA